MPMNLAINGIDLGRQRGGNETYLEGLIGALALMPEVGVLDVLVGAHFDDQGNTQARPSAKIRYVNTGPYRRLPFLLWQQSLALRHRPVSHDWYLSTYFLPPVKPAASGLFVHDLSFLSIPRAYPASIRIYMRWLTAWSVARADHVFVLSRFVLHEFRRFYRQVPDNRLSVLYPGISSDFKADRAAGHDEAVLARHGLKAGYILSVSSIHPRKNTAGLLRAYAILRERLGEATPDLALAGQQYWGSEAVEREAGAPGVVFLGFVPQADLPALYRNAGVFVYPSVYEGFGLPPVEAMASGVPVICGDNSSLPEAVGDAAITVDVRQPSQIAGAMERVLASGSLRAEMRARGLARAGQFTWAATAAGLIDILDETHASPHASSRLR